MSAKFELLFSLWLGFSGVIIAKSIQNGTRVEIKNEDILSRLEMVERKLENMNMTMLKLQEDEDHQRLKPMFMVKLSRDGVELNTYSIVKFDSVVLDEGGNFNAGDGIFVAPVSGVYMFSWTIQQHPGKTAYTELRVDNVVKATSSISLSSSYVPATQIVFCKVKKGDHVWIQTTGDHSKNYFDVFNRSHCSFMGILMKTS